jgi:hypothetical protein
MKIHYILCMAIVFPQLALADSSSSNRSLGTVQATLDFCAHINPGAAAQYQAQGKLIVGGNSQNSDDYKQGYTSAQAALARISEREAKDTCVGFLNPSSATKDNQAVTENMEQHDGKPDSDGRKSDK